MAFKIQNLVGQNLLVERVEAKPQSEFETAGVDPRGPVFLIKHAGSESAYKAGEHVLLAPGDYDALEFEGQKFLHVMDDRIIAKLEVQK